MQRPKPSMSIDEESVPQQMLGGVDINGNGRIDLSIGQLAELARSQGWDTTRFKSASAGEGLGFPNPSMLNLQTPQFKPDTPVGEIQFQSLAMPSVFEQLVWTPVSSPRGDGGIIGQFLAELFGAIFSAVGAFFGIRKGRKDIRSKLKKR